MVDNRLEASEHTSLWPKTRRGAVLYALAAMVAIVVGVIPALWINRWRGEADAAPPKQVERPVVMPTVEPIEAAATPEQKPTPTDQALAAEPTVPTVEQAAIDMEPTVPVAKTTKRPRPKVQRPKAAAKQTVTKPAPTKPKPPPCDIYLHPHGCPNG